MRRRYAVIAKDLSRPLRVPHGSAVADSFFARRELFVILYHVAENGVFHHSLFNIRRHVFTVRNVKPRKIGNVRRVVIVRRKAVMLDEPLCGHARYQFIVDIAQPVAVKTYRGSGNANAGHACEMLVYPLVRLRYAVVVLIGDDERGGGRFL